MGDNLLRRQIRNFKRRKDLARAEAKIPKLYERAELIETVYEAVPNNGDAFKENDKLHVMAESDSTVSLVKGHRKVATIGGEAAKALHDALAEPDTAGVAEVRITAVSEISGTFSVQVIRD
jgi:hypothetical protein